MSYSASPDADTTVSLPQASQFNGRSAIVALSHTPQQNHLLGALPQDECARVCSSLQLVEMSPGKILHESGDVLRHVYFPIDCIVSLLYTLEDGASAEIAVVGNDGLIGVSLILGGNTTPNQAVVQSAGHAFRLPAAILQELFEANRSIQVLWLRYTQALIIQMAQVAVCNRHHTVDQQLCRLLLNSLDRLDRSVLNMTQQQIANMLGVRREGVTDAALKLQKMGVIEYARGKITVLDRERLENLCCECYTVVRRETDRLSAAARGPLVEPGRQFARTNLPGRRAREEQQRSAILSTWKQADNFLSSPRRSTRMTAPEARHDQEP